MIWYLFSGIKNALFWDKNHKFSGVVSTSFVLQSTSPKVEKTRCNRDLVLATHCVRGKCWFVFGVLHCWFTILFSVALHPRMCACMCHSLLLRQWKVRGVPAQCSRVPTFKAANWLACGGEGICRSLYRAQAVWWWQNREDSSCIKQYGIVASGGVV